MSSGFRASSRWSARLQKLLTRLGLRRQKLEAYPIAPLTGIGRTPLGIEAYDLCSEDRRLVAEIVDEFRCPTEPVAPGLPPALPKEPDATGFRAGER